MIWITRRKVPRGRLVLRALAALILFAGFGLWLSHGAEVGFWKTSVGKRVEVLIVPGMPELGTQETSEWEERFVSGIETPLLSLVLALCLWGLSLLFLSSPETKPESIDE